MDNNTKEEVHFQNDDVFDTISEILEKNGVKETVYDAADIENAEDSLILTVFDLTKDFAKEKISDQGFINSLQKKFKLSPGVAKNIFQGVKEQILPQAEKIAVGTQTNIEKPAINLAPLILGQGENIVKTPTAEKSTEKEEKKSEERKTRTIKDIAKPPNIIKKENASFPRKADSYREPIE